MMTLEIYRREDGLWAWRLKAGNGHIVATDGGQGYTRKSECRRMAKKVVMPIVPLGSLGVGGIRRADVRIVELDFWRES